MKIRVFILFLIILNSTTVFSQIPNYSFETWTDSLPDFWSINSSPPLFLPVIQSTDAHLGGLAIQGTVIIDSGIPFAPFIQTIPPGTHFGFPITANYDTLYGWIKSDMIDSDLTSIEVYAYDSLGNTIGFGTGYFGSTPIYDQFAIPITYTAGLFATEMSITIQILDTNAGSLYSPGSYFIIDDLSFQIITTGIKPPENAGTFSIVPNPANSSINIKGIFNNESKYEIRIYNTLGIMLYHNSISADEFSDSSINVNNFPEGFYFIRISDDEKYSTQRMIITR